VTAGDLQVDPAVREEAVGCTPVEIVAAQAAQDTGNRVPAQGLDIPQAQRQEAFPGALLPDGAG
jgi:hypothetical protein